MSNGTVEPRNPWPSVTLLVVLALFLRAASPLFLPNIANADEVYQTVEQGYRVLTGHGFVPWEFYYGIRSWIFPGLLAAVIKIAWSLGMGTEGAFLLIRLVMVAVSLPLVVCAYFWGRRTGLPGAALISGGLVAVWPDLAYMSSHPLNEVVAAALLVPGIFLAEPAPGRDLGRSRIFVAAFLLAWAAMFRVQLAPAALLAWVWMIWPAWRARLPVAVAGGLVPVVIAGAVDWLTWGRPLQSLWLNAIVNWAYGAASTFGTSPWYAYLAKIDVMWGGATPFVALVALIAMPRARLVAGTVAVMLAAHMLIAHKEYRFIYPMIPLVLTLAGIGTARLIRLLAEGLRSENPEWGRGAPSKMTAAACVVWMGVVGSLYLSREFIDLFRHHTGLVQASFDVARKPNVCGVAIWNLNWLYLSGEFSLGHVVPVFYPDNEAEFADRAPGFNTVIYQRERQQRDPELPGSNWQSGACHPMEAKLPQLLAHDEHEYEICVAERPGSCAAEPSLYPPLFIPKELKAAPFPWLDHPLPEESPRVAAGAASPASAR